MAKSQEPMAVDESQLNNAEILWDRFIKLSKISCIIVAVVLLLMGLFLV